MKRGAFPVARRAVVPIVHGFDDSAAVRAALALAGEVTLVGLVPIPRDQAISAGMASARDVRRRLRQLAAARPNVIAGTAVHVSHDPWAELLDTLEAESTDLLVMSWGAQSEALGIVTGAMLGHPPCDLVLVHGAFPDVARRVLVPMRGGPHAELALRLGLSLQPEHLTTLHLRPPTAQADAPFRGLEQVLHDLPEVDSRSATTQDPAQTILEHAREFDVIVMGATAAPVRSEVSLGIVADRVMREGVAPVLAVKTRRTMALGTGSETGAKAISILVDKWFAQNTYEAAEFDDIDHLVDLKRAQGVSISLALPALNEEETVGEVIASIKAALMERVPLLDEIVLIDSSSIDRTREIVERLGVPVYIHQQVLPNWGARDGKGEALWKSLFVTRGDVLAWIDTDIVNIHPRFVYGVVGPLLADPHIQFVKGFYRRPLKVGEKIQAGGGGRVTELTARPLLNLFYPQLSGVVQPLSGEYAGRRSALEQVSFFTGYGVETGLLIDMFEKFGLGAIAQVDLLERIHHNQNLDALGKMSFAILQAVIRKLEKRYGQTILEDVNKSMKLIRYEAGVYSLDVEEIVERERPPMLHVPEYVARRLASA